MRQQRNPSFRKTNAILNKISEEKKIGLLKTLPFKLNHRQHQKKSQYLHAYQQKLPMGSKLPPIKLHSQSRCSTSISGDQKSLQDIQVGLLNIQKHEQQPSALNNPQRRDVLSLLQSTRSKLHPSKTIQKTNNSPSETSHPLRMLARQTMRTVVIILQEDDFSQRSIKKSFKTRVTRSFTLPQQDSPPQRELSPMRKYSISGWDTFQQSE